MPWRVGDGSVQRQAQVVVQAQRTVQADGEVQAVAAGQRSATVVDTAVQVPARGNPAWLHEDPGPALSLAGQQVYADIVRAQTVELVQPLFDVRQEQRLPEHVGKCAGQGERQLADAELYRLDEAFADDDVQRCIVLKRLA
ncbi:hypothetical protein D3C78_1534340 [compost metagenome]